MSTNVVDIIARKRRGEELHRDEIELLVSGYLAGRIPDYQMSAWLMAVCCQGMTRRETSDLTAAMAASGTRLDLSAAPWPVADKHSTGGVGDKTTLVVAPLVRACGVAVAKMSGRGLGFTGGTADKLEAIPGYRVDLSAAEFRSQVEREGIALSGHAADLAPADGRIYALRDVTGTVDSIPLIASSIMSKKLAVGASVVVLDVKVGAGAFMRDRSSAEELARTMIAIGTDSGLRVSALVTPMDEPLGFAVGNALEVEEAVRTLQGSGPKDLELLSVDLAAEMLYLAGKSDTLEAGRAMAQEALSTGRALECFERLVAIQNGDPRVVTHPELMGCAPVTVPVVADESGWVVGVDARGIASAAMTVGAGRRRKGDRIDSTVGIVLRKKSGAETFRGDHLAEVHALDPASAEHAVDEVRLAFRISEQRPQQTDSPRAFRVNGSGTGV